MQIWTVRSKTWEDVVTDAVCHQHKNGCVRDWWNPGILYRLKIRAINYHKYSSIGFWRTNRLIFINFFLYFFIKRGENFCSRLSFCGYVQLVKLHPASVLLALQPLFCTCALVKRKVVMSIHGRHSSGKLLPCTCALVSSCVNQKKYMYLYSSALITETSHP